MLLNGGTTYIAFHIERTHVNNVVAGIYIKTAPRDVQVQYPRASSIVDTNNKRVLFYLQAQQVGMMTETHSYLITSLVST